MIFYRLKKPHPFIFNSYSIVIPSALTFLIIVLLAPLYFQELKISLRVLSALVVSSIVAASIYTSMKFLKQVFPEFISEDSWTVGKELLIILFNLFIISVLIFMAVLIFRNDSSPLLSVMIKTTLITLAISIFPIIFLVLFEQYRHQNKQLEKAHNLTDSLINKNKLLSKITSAVTIDEQAILIKSESDDIELRLKSNELVYVKSDGNYVEIYYVNGDEIQKKLIRNRIKNIETVLPNKNFLRCHNRFIVNGNAIIKIEGNARNLLLHLKNVTEVIPVSRAKANLISEFINNLSGLVAQT